MEVDYEPEVVRELLAKKRCWKRLTVLGHCLVLLLFSIISVDVVYQRIQVDREASAFLADLTRDPVAFLQYTGYMPASTSEVTKTQQHQQDGDDDYFPGGARPHTEVEVRPYTMNNLNQSGVAAHIFLAKYGGWVVDAANILVNHCDLDQMSMVLNKNEDKTFCGPGSANSLGCYAGFYRDASFAPSLPTASEEDSLSSSSSSSSTSSPQRSSQRYRRRRQQRQIYSGVAAVTTTTTTTTTTTRGGTRETPTDARVRASCGPAPTVFLPRKPGVLVVCALGGFCNSHPVKHDVPPPRPPKSPPQLRRLVSRSRSRSRKRKRGLREGPSR